MSIKLTHEERRERRAYMVAAIRMGIHPHVVAKAYNVSSGTVQNAARDANVPFLRKERKIIVQDAEIKSRNLEIVRLRSEKHTLEEIGNAHNLSRERVRQILQDKFITGCISQYKPPKLCPECNIEYDSKRICCSDNCSAKRRLKIAQTRNAEWSKYLFVDLICKECQISFKRTKYQHRVAKHQGTANVYCSRNCYERRNLNQESIDDDTDKAPKQNTTLANNR